MSSYWQRQSYHSPNSQSDDHTQPKSSGREEEYPKSDKQNIRGYDDEMGRTCLSKAAATTVCKNEEHVSDTDCEEESK